MEHGVGVRKRVGLDVAGGACWLGGGDRKAF
jgi:hypothetical protein